MKKLLAAILAIGLVLSFAVSSFALVPGDGIWDPDTEPDYKALSSKTAAPISAEMLDLIAEKESILYTRATYPVSVSLPLTQYPQNNGYYCGPASVRSILMHKGYNYSQTTLAGNTWLKTDQFSSTPWFLVDGSTMAQYPVPVTLKAITSYNYVPFPFGPLTTLYESELKLRVQVTTYSNYGVAALGQSKASSTHPSHLPGYPTNKDVNHWLAVNGYADSGNTIRIVDSANSANVSWGANVSPKYTITLTKFTAFANHRGIVW